MPNKRARGQIYDGMDQSLLIQFLHHVTSTNDLHQRLQVMINVLAQLGLASGANWQLPATGLRCCVCLLKVLKQASKALPNAL